MLAEFVKALTDLCFKAQESKIQKPPAEPDHVYLLDGKKQAAAPEPREHEAADLGAVVAFAQRFDVDGLNSDERPAVWYSRAGVVCLVHDDTRRDRVELKLQYAPQLLELQKLDVQKKAWSQTDLILWLRVYFSACLEEHPTFLTMLRHIQWQSSGNSAGNIQHGKSSVGKAIEAELTGGNEFPETITFEVPIFAGCLPQLRGKVPCAFDISPKDERFVLIPLAGSIKGVLQAAEEQIGTLLERDLGDGFGRLYYGVP